MKDPNIKRVQVVELSAGGTFELPDPATYPSFKYVVPDPIEARPEEGADEPIGLFFAYRYKVVYKARGHIEGGEHIWYWAFDTAGFQPCRFVEKLLS
jgi:hypothetical protein